MAAESLVTMDGPGPFVFGRLQGPIEVQRAPDGTAIAIRGLMQVNETGRRVIVRIPLAIEDARTLLELLGDCLRPGASVGTRSKAGRGKPKP
jgi:hypothetical protein